MTGENEKIALQLCLGGGVNGATQGATETSEPFLTVKKKNECLPLGGAV